MKLRCLSLTEDERDKLKQLVSSRTSPAHHIERASIFLYYADELSVAKIASELKLDRGKIYRCINKAFAVGVEKALDDLPRSGRSSVITPEATLWILSLACQAPKELGYSHERWTTDLLAQHAREECVKTGHPSVIKLAQGTVVKLLNKFEIKPHKVKYYLEVRDPDFDRKMVEVLKVYKLAELLTLNKELMVPLDEHEAVGEGQPALPKKKKSKKTGKEKPSKLLTRLAEFIKKQQSEEATGADSKVVCETEQKPETDSNLVVDESADEATTTTTPSGKEPQTMSIDELLKLAENCNSHKQPLSVAVLSYDEKPGIQAIKNKAPDLPPVPRQYSCQGRDYEYVRCGTLSLLAGTDLVSGNVHAMARERHRSSEFVDYLKMLDGLYPKNMKLVILLDNHSAHKSKETQKYLEIVPDRFLFVFTPVHASWLNIIESFFSKMARSVLRGMRVSSLEDLRKRLLQYIKEVNQHPVVFRWRYGLELISA
jgi:transposase